MDTPSVSTRESEPLTDPAPTLGRVVGLWRYPVKSMAGEALDTADVAWNGIAGDRRWAFVRDEAVHGGFPWLTLRQRPILAHYRPYFTDPERPDQSPTMVRSPDGTVRDVTDPSLAQELYSPGARVMRQDRGAFDAFPISIITTQTVERLGEMVGATLDPQRFRPNILVDATNGEPFAEDGWVGRVLRLGGTRVRVDKRDGRCVVITIDPTTTERDPSILRAVAQHRGGCLGVYGSVVEPGRVGVGDTVSFDEKG